MKIRHKKLVSILVVSVLTIFSTSNVFAEDSLNDPAFGGEYDQLGDGENGFDHIKDNNKLLREVYNSYTRDATWFVYINGNPYTATKRTGNYFYVPQLGNTYHTNQINYFDEYWDITPQPYVVKRASKMYSSPWQGYNDKFFTGYTVQPGTYTATKSAYDFVYITTPDGHSGWISPQYENNAYIGTGNIFGYFANSLSKLSEDAIDGIPIYQSIVNIREDARFGGAMIPKYVTIHNTANEGYGADAKAHASLQHRNTWTSWHYTVDNTQIYQSLPINEISYHAGDGVSMGNGGTVSIEICENSNGNYAQAEKNAAKLTAHVLYAYGLPADAVKMHRDWSGKHCPHNIIDGTKGTMGWDGFKAAVKAEYDKLAAQNETVNTTPPAGSEKYITSAGLNFMNNNLSGFELGKTADQQIQKMKAANPKADIKVVDKNGNPSSTVIKTGDIIVIKDPEKEFKFNAVVYGDTSGDGKISAADYVHVKNHIMNRSSLTGPYKQAADAQRNNKISAGDYVFIKNYIMGRGTISQ